MSLWFVISLNGGGVDADNSATAESANVPQLAPEAEPRVAMVPEDHRETPAAGTPPAVIESKPAAETSAESKTAEQPDAPAETKPAGEDATVAPPAAAADSKAEPAPAAEGSIKLEPLAPSAAATAPTTGPTEVAPSEQPPAEEPPARPAGEPAADRPSAGLDGRRVLSRADVDERLAAALPGVEFNKVPLGQFVTFMSDFTNLPIMIDEQALAAIGKGRTTPVTIKLADTTAGDAMRAALARLGLICRLHDGRLVVTARAAAKPAPDGK
jgi:hypothetical protein